MSTRVPVARRSRSARRGSLVADENCREPVAAPRAVQRLPRVGVEVAERLGPTRVRDGDARPAGLAVVGVLWVGHCRAYGRVGETDFAARRY